MPPDQGNAGAGRLLAATVLVFLVAVLMGRLLLARGDLWQLFLLALPLLLVALSVAVGFVRALILVALFAATTLAARWLLQVPGLGWAALLLVPILLLAVGVGLRVAKALFGRNRPGDGSLAGGQGTEEK